MAIVSQRFGALEYFRDEAIPVPHCFTTRLGGVSQGHLAALNLGCGRGDDPENVRRNYERLGEALGFSQEDLVLTRQTHSDEVRLVTEQDAGKGVDHRLYPACDGLVTNTPGVTLVVFAADCTPILLHDPVTGAVGAVHAGWRGTAADIAGKAVQKMAEAFGSRPEDIRAAIGPNIGACCFETNGDVPHAMLSAFGKEALAFIRRQDEKYYVNLKEMNGLALRHRGVTRITVSTLCTACTPELFWSYRKMGDLRGAQCGVIRCEGVRE